MATFTKTLSRDSRYSVKLVVNETSIDVSTNTSVVSYSLQATKSSGSGYYTSNKTNTIKVTLDGTEVVNKKVAYDFTGSTPKTITLASGTKTITHDIDGTKTITCSGYFKDNENSLGSATASGNLTLTPLHKAPEPSITSITETNSTLTSYGIANNQFVAYISQKQFVVSATTYDSATITSYTIKNNTTTSTSSTSPLTLNFKNRPVTITNNQVAIELSATDSMGSTSTIVQTYNSYIPYSISTIVNSNFTTKRAGQLTGNITLKASGTFYNGSVGNQTITPKVYYRYKLQSATSYNSWTQIANTSITKSGNNWSTSITLSGFNYQNSYDVQLKVSDNVAEANGLSYVTASSVVPVGEPTWTEYKDHVDFKKLTINKQNILAPYTLFSSTATSGNIALSESAANYVYIEIYYYCSSGTHYSSVKIDAPNNKNVQLKGENDDGTFNYMYCAYYTISGSTITRNKEIRWRLSGSGNSNRSTSTTEIKVYKVIGYK